MSEPYKKWLRVVFQMQDTPKNRILADMMTREVKITAGGCDAEGAILKLEEITLLLAEKPVNTEPTTPEEHPNEPAGN